MTNVTATILLITSLCTVAASQLLMKCSLSHIAGGGEDGSWTALLWRFLLDPLAWLAVLLILVGVICWYLAMVRLPLSLMLPVAGIIAPVVAVGAHFVLGESLTAPKIAAMLVIAAGVAWLAWLNT